MNKKKLLWSFFFVNSLFAINNESNQTPNVSPVGKWVGGYFANWSYWRAPAGKVKNLISSPSATYITYAFLTMVTSDNFNKTETTYGGMNITEPGAIGTVDDVDYISEPNVATDNINSLINYKSESKGNTLLMASIGGWSYSPRFTTFAKDIKKNPAALNVFAKSIVTWLKGHPKFDGISIDWEYPGWGQDETSDNHIGEGIIFNKMISAIHNQFVTLENQTGKHYYLSIATVASLDKFKGDNNTIDWKTIATQIDWIDLMAFDINGEFNAPSGTALSQVSTISNLENVINGYIAAGVLANQIVLGSPLYAREMLVVDKPTANNNYSYNDSLNYSGIAIYSPQTDYLNPPNITPYYPATGMVDNTGVYSYSCFINLLPGGQGVNPNCPVNSVEDNRGLWGAPLPSGLKYISNVDGLGNAWIYGSKQNIVTDPSGSSFYQAYPVYSLETQDSLKYKINNLVIKLKLRGVWFWDLTQDSINSPSMSLFVTAYNSLNS